MDLFIHPIQVALVSQKNTAVQLSQVQCLLLWQSHNAAVLYPMNIRQLFRTIDLTIQTVFRRIAFYLGKEPCITRAAEQLRRSIPELYVSQWNIKRKNERCSIGNLQHRELNASRIQPDILQRFHFMQSLILVYRNETLGAIGTHSIPQCTSIFRFGMYLRCYIGQRCKLRAEVVKKQIIENESDLFMPVAQDDHMVLTAIQNAGSFRH